MSFGPVKPTASISLDLDNLWSYMKTRGDESWRERPTYIPTFVPLLLDVLDELAVDIDGELIAAIPKVLNGDRVAVEGKPGGRPVHEDRGLQELAP